MKLTTRHYKLIAAMLTHDTIEAAAKSAGVSRTSAFAYAKIPEFQQELKARQRQQMENVTRKLREYAPQAAEEVFNIMMNEDTSDTVKLRAAIHLIEQSYKAHDLSDLQAQMEEISEQYMELMKRFETVGG